MDSRNAERCYTLYQIADFLLYANSPLHDNIQTERDYDERLDVMRMMKYCFP